MGHFRKVCLGKPVDLIIAQHSFIDVVKAQPHADLFMIHFSQGMSAMTLKEGKSVSRRAVRLFLLLGVSFPLHICHKS